MATKIQLQQLLLEDQEPFHLHQYIAERQTKLKSSSPNNQLHLTRITKPISDKPTNSNSESSVLHFPVTFCKKACFNGGNVSPELLNRASSPVLNLNKSPVKLLQIPSKTAALLLEAAIRIHKQSSRKRKNRFGTDFGFFGSVLKKLSFKSQKPNPNSIDAAKHQTTSSRHLNMSDSDICLNGRRSDAVWSEDKSLDSETSCSSANSDLTRTAGEHIQSPSRCPSPSPSQCTVKDAEEEEKEQCSPVSVLDPPFEQAKDDHNHHDDGDDDDGFGCECSYSIVERKNQQLLHKLNRFEALADFNPQDLQKLILVDELYNHHDSKMLEETDDIASQILNKCSFHDQIHIDMKGLVSDLITEKEIEDKVDDYTKENYVVNAVCDRLSLWNGVQQNTIDMMIDEDFKQELCKWKMNKDELRFVAMDIELAIFVSLVKEVFI